MGTEPAKEEGEEKGNDFVAHGGDLGGFGGFWVIKL